MLSLVGKRRDAEWRIRAGSAAATWRRAAGAAKGVDLGGVFGPDEFGGAQQLVEVAIPELFHRNGQGVECSVRIGGRGGT